MSSAGGSDDEEISYLYQYVPSLAAAVVAIVIFAILTIAHSYLLVKQRAWFCIAFTVGGLCKCFLLGIYLSKPPANHDIIDLQSRQWAT